MAALPDWVMCRAPERRDDGGMTKGSALTTFSNDLADAVESAGASVVQVYGHRRPGSGVVYTSDVVVTTARALGRGDGLHVRTADGAAHDAQLVGWEPG